MLDTPTSLRRAAASFAVAAMLALGTHAAVASLASGCGSESGMIGLTCPIGAYGDAYSASATSGRTPSVSAWIPA